jgi:hypothetical protein
MSANKDRGYGVVGPAGQIMRAMKKAATATATNATMNRGTTQGRFRGTGGSEMRGAETRLSAGRGSSAGAGRAG